MIVAGLTLGLVIGAPTGVLIGIGLVFLAEWAEMKHNNAKEKSNGKR